MNSNDLEPDHQDRKHKWLMILVVTTVSTATADTASAVFLHWLGVQ